MTSPTPPSPFPDGVEVTSRLSPARGPLERAVLDALRASGADVFDDPGVLAEASRDWWPLGIGWATRSMVGSLAQAVVRPRSTEQVAAVLALCNEKGIPVTPAGGRSGVVGGSIPLEGGVLLDLTNLASTIEVDETSLLVTVDAGVFGPELEDRLRQTGSGYTLGHWPQSFNLATVGGWLACRGAGQYSNRYGKIEDMVRALTVVLADGTIVHTDGGGPRSATGPNLTQLFVGSEGTLGVITSATFVLHPAPAQEIRGAWSFDTFDGGMEACRRILQRGATPAVLRLYDEIESQRSFNLDRTVLIMLDEGDPLILEATDAIVQHECAGATSLDPALVERWLEHRNNVDQLAPLWANRIIVDTIEMAASWSTLSAVRTDVLDALRSVPGTLVASVHQSHAYLDGACLYFTFAGRAPEGTSDLDDDEAYYRACWDAATSVIERHGAALSHHHGIGLNRARFLPSALGEGMQVLRSIKGTLDPRGILNPGKLGLQEREGW